MASEGCFPRALKYRLNVRLTQLTSLAGKAGTSLPHFGCCQFTIKSCPSDDYLPGDRKFADRGEGHQGPASGLKSRLMPVSDDVAAHVHYGHTVGTDRLDQLGYLVVQSADPTTGIEQDETRIRQARKQSER